MTTEYHSNVFKICKKNINGTFSYLAAGSVKTEAINLFSTNTTTLGVEQSGRWCGNQEGPLIVWAKLNNNTKGSNEFSIVERRYVFTAFTAIGCLATDTNRVIIGYATVGNVDSNYIQLVNYLKPEITWDFQYLVIECTSSPLPPYVIQNIKFQQDLNNRTYYRYKDGNNQCIYVYIVAYTLEYQTGEFEEIFDINTDFSSDIEITTKETADYKYCDFHCVEIATYYQDACEWPLDRTKKYCLIHRKATISCDTPALTYGSTISSLKEELTNDDLAYFRRRFYTSGTKVNINYLEAESATLTLTFIDGTSDTYELTFNNEESTTTTNVPTYCTATLDGQKLYHPRWKDPNYIPEEGFVVNYNNNDSPISFSQNFPPIITNILFWSDVSDSGHEIIDGIVPLSIYVKPIIRLGSFVIKNIKLFYYNSSIEEPVQIEVTGYDEEQDFNEVSLNEAGLFKFIYKVLVWNPDINDDEWINLEYNKSFAARYSSSIEVGNVTFYDEENTSGGYVPRVFLNRGTNEIVCHIGLLERQDGTYGHATKFTWTIDADSYTYVDTVSKRTGEDIDPTTGELLLDTDSFIRYNFTSSSITYTVSCAVTEINPDAIEHTRSSDISFDYYRPTLNIKTTLVDQYSPLSITFEPMPPKTLLVDAGTYNIKKIELYRKWEDGGYNVILSKSYESTDWDNYPDENPSDITDLTGFTYTETVDKVGTHKFFARIWDYDSEFTIDLPEDQGYYQFDERYLIKIPDLLLSFSEDIAPPYKITDSINLTPSFAMADGSEFPLSKITKLEWISNDVTFNETITNNWKREIWSIEVPKNLFFSEVASYSMFCRATLYNGLTYTSSTHYYKIYNDIAPSEYAIDIAMDPDQLSRLSPDTTKEAARDYLYDAIELAMRSNKVYFAPRTWPEAGLISSITKYPLHSNSLEYDNYYVRIYVKHRVSTFLNGMEDLSYDSLPVNPVDTAEPIGGTVNPRGVIFCTPTSDNPEVIRLSAAERISIIDKYTGTRVYKEGLALHPIVMYAQNDNTTYNSLNVFGPVAPASFDFSQSPFQPWLTLLNQAEYENSISKQYKFYAITYDAVYRTAKFDYKPQYIHSIKPFDVDYLKFRKYQNQETSSYIYNNSTAWNTYDPASTSIAWGRGDLSSTTDIGKRKGWIYNGSKLTWLQAGSILLSATEGDDKDKFTTFYGQPNVSGVWGNAEKYARMAYFESLDNVYTRYGILDSAGSIKNCNNVCNYQILGAAVDAIVGENTILSNISQYMNTKSVTIIQPITQSNRYVVFVKGNKIYLWDDYLSQDFANYTLLPKISENIYNVNKIGDLKIEEKNFIVESNNSITTILNFPLATKFFSGKTVLLNLNYTDPKANFKTTYSSLNEDQNISINITYASTNSKIIYADLFDKFIYYTTSSAIGIANLGENNTYYMVDTETGQIIENSSQKDSTLVINKAQIIMDNETATIPVELNPENGAQTIYIAGFFGNMPFENYSHIILNDRIKPIINGKKKICNNEYEFGKPIEIKFRTKGWIPDKIMICPTQLEETAYNIYFSQATAETDITIDNIGQDNYEITVRKSGLETAWMGTNNLYIDGTHYLALGLENYPTGSKSNGFRANYQQNTSSEIMEKFATSITLVRDSRINIDIKNAATVGGIKTLINDYIQFNISIDVAFIISVENIEVNNIYIDSNDNTIITYNNTFENLFGKPANIENYSFINRLANHDMIDNNGKRYTVIGNTLKDIIILGNHQSDIEAATKIAINSFIPYYYQVNSSLYASSDIIALEFKNLDDYKINFYDVVNNVKRIKGNMINITLLDQNKEFSFAYNTLLNFGEILDHDMTAGATDISIGFYAKFDATNKIFSKKYDMGARSIDSQFYHIFDKKYQETDENIYIRIKSSEDLDTSKEITLKFINSTTLEEISNWSFSNKKTGSLEITQVLENDKTIFKAILSKDLDLVYQDLLSVNIELTAYDKYGNFIEYN